tara:strand:+ start:59 stop:514 length:456 start_codon:yes stop_codon:yes gene_type:complete
MIRKILITILLLILTSCGFTPIYNVANEADYNINLVEVKGDSIINNKIISEVSRIANKDAKKVFKIKVTTNYSKTIISKDSKGSATNYELRVDSIFNIEYENNLVQVTISEKQNIEKISDMFEQKNYENTLKSNFAISIANRLNIELLSIK